MSNLNREMLIKNIEMLMRKQGINQAALIKATNIPQPKMSKCLNRNEKDQFTLQQIWDIADYFHVSIDFLIGRKTMDNKTEAPSTVTVCKQLAQLIESERISRKEVEVDESVFVRDEQTEPGDYPFAQQRTKNHYTAFYFSDYLHADIFNFSEPGWDDVEFDFSTGGNFSKDNAEINKFLSYYFKLYDLLQKNGLPREIFDAAISDRLKTMEE